MKILAINLGSTSTKLAVFEDKTPIDMTTLRHPQDELAACGTIMGQKDYRKHQMDAWLAAQGHHPSGMDIIVSRCGPLMPMKSGVYPIDDDILMAAQYNLYGEHAANIGLIIAAAWGREFAIPAVFADPPVTDELADIARISGFAGMERRSVFHALNTRRIIRLYCDKVELDPFQHNFIIAHLGGGISVAAFHNFKAIDVSNAIDGEGPFSPERTGSLPYKSVLTLVNEYEGDTAALNRALYQHGGLQSYFGTNDVPALMERAKTEPEVRLIMDAMCYNIAKSIGSMATVLKGEVEQIILTGGLAYNKEICENITEQVRFIAPVTVSPGEDELAALAEGAYQYMTSHQSIEELT